MLSIKLKNVYLSIFTLSILITFVLAVFTQTERKTVENDETERKIVSVKRINLVLDYVENTPEKKKINEYVEIELFSSVKIPITNSSHYVRIGYQEFPVERWSGDMQTAFVRLTPNEFENLMNNSYVSYHIGKKMDSKELKEYIEKDLLSEVAGPVFGRLNKDMINQFPTVEINNVQP